MNSEINFCKYHPIVNATSLCNKCQISICNDCVSEDRYSTNGKCYICSNELVKLKTKNTILPFWRRLQESFKYPINIDSIMLIIGLAFLTTVLNYVPGIFAILWSLLLTGALFKYSFSCLNNTSNGNLKAPDITEAYGGGFGLVFQLIFLVITVFMVFWGVNYFLGSMVASLVGVFLICAFPAIIINFGLTENMLDALNPQNVIRLMTAVGLPYGILLGFIMIMVGSVSIINEFIGHDYSLVSRILQSSVSNYYTIVLFHIMGYMIYQYHDELEFDVSADSKTNQTQKSVLERNLANIDILLKEGDAEAAIHLFSETIKSYPAEKTLKPQFFELLIATQNHEHLVDFASEYLAFLSHENRSDQVPLILKRIYKVDSKFKPKTAQLRHEIASLCHQKGDSRSVVMLINGLQKDFPEYLKIVEAYELMAEALEQLPNMARQALACRKLMSRLGKQLQT